MRKYVRWFVAVFAIAFTGFVARQLKSRTPEPVPPSVVKADPKAVAESTSGSIFRFDANREAFTVYAKRQLTYEDGSTKLFGVTIEAPERGSGGRTFKVTANEGRVGAKESTFVLDGDVRLTASDGMTLHTEHATYEESDGAVRTPGPADFARGRVRGSGTGMTYDKGRDILSILADAHVIIAPDSDGADSADVTSGTADFARRDKYLRFEKTVTIRRPSQTIESDNVIARLTDDENHVDSVELHGGGRITTRRPAPGTLESVTGRELNLKYAADGETLQRAFIAGEGVLHLASEAGTEGRRIEAPTIDVTMAPDGSTPVALSAKDNVLLTFPPDPNTPGRTIRSQSLDAQGDAEHGLTRARFTGSVDFRERGTDVDRHATAGTLDVGLKSGFSEIEDARFTHKVRFVDGTLTADAAVGVYDVDNGTLELSGSEPGVEAPHMVNDRVAVDGVEIQVTLAGPHVTATGSPVKSVLQPPKPGDKDGGTKMPTMLKQDQAVTVLADSLDYDNDASKGTYTGNSRLFQGDTSIKASDITLDQKTGNLTAKGPVTTTTVLDQTDKDGKKTRSRSTGTAKEFAYDDATRRLTYIGTAHMTGPEGDMNADKIELFLKESGDELDRAEGYENLKLREQSRLTVGSRLTYTTADDKYVVGGRPVEITDSCGRKTTGKTLTFNKGADTIVVDGSDQIRTQTKGGGKCP